MSEMHVAVQRRGFHGGFHLGYHSNVLYPSYSSARRQSFVSRGVGHVQSLNFVKNFVSQGAAMERVVLYSVFGVVEETTEVPSV